MDRGDDGNNDGWGSRGRCWFSGRVHGDDLAAEAVDAEDKVDDTKVVAVAVDEEDITETTGSTLMLIFPAPPKILT